MPECSGGMTERAEEVTGTMAMPKPMPARAMVQPMADMPADGERRSSVRARRRRRWRNPRPWAGAARAATDRPVTGGEDHQTAIGTNSSRAVAERVRRPPGTERRRRTRRTWRSRSRRPRSRRAEAAVFGRSALPASGWQLAARTGRSRRPPPRRRRRGVTIHQLKYPPSRRRWWRRWRPPTPPPRARTRARRAAVLRVGVLGKRPGSAHEGQHAEHEVEPEDRPPPPHPGERPADDRAGGQGQTGDRCPHPERPGTLTPVRVELADHRQGARLRGSRPDTHDHPSGDQHLHVTAPMRRRSSRRRTPPPRRA